MGEFLVDSKEQFDGYKESFKSVECTIAAFFKDIREAVDREEENVLAKIR